MSEQKRKVVIVGSGPAGLTAAIYAGRAQLKPLVAAGGIQNQQMPGGQLMITTEVENYPGFPEGISGPELMDKMMDQAKRFGVDIVEEFATEFDLSTPGGPFKVKVGSDWHETESIIFATGAVARWLGAENEEKFKNKGISACATCDGPLPCFRNKDIYVVGGGDTAMEEALFLTRFASKVYIVHRRDELRASKVMQKRALDHEKIEVLWNTVVVSYKGEDALEKIVLKNVQTNETREVEAAGCFMAIGHVPATQYLKDTPLELDQQGYIKVRDQVYTNIDGVFTAGDVHDTVFRQAVTAAGFGCMSAIQCERWLEAKNA